MVQALNVGRMSGQTLGQAFHRVNRSGHLVCCLTATDRCSDAMVLWCHGRGIDDLTAAGALLLDCWRDVKHQAPRAVLSDCSRIH